MAADNLTAPALADLLTKVITGVEGGAEGHWREIVGPIHRLPIIDNVRSNWSVIPGGTRRERDVIGKAAEVVRQAHPYVRR